ncbi:MAG: hypothetical protein AB1586_04980 [Pseudomonadota bacterium]
MINVWRSAGAVVVVVATGLGSPAEAFDLTGAWASAPELCGLVFTKKGTQVDFAELSDLYGSGFIVDGSRIRGKAARCTIKSRKDSGDQISLAASCATTIMTSDVQFSLKVNGDDNITRQIPEMMNMSLNYSRCKL